MATLPAQGRRGTCIDCGGPCDARRSRCRSCSSRENARRNPPPNRQKGTVHKGDWTPATIAEAWRRWADAHNGEPPRKDDCKAANNLPSFLAVCHHFGTLTAASIAAGVTPRPVGVNMTTATRSEQRGLREANRQMVTGQGFADNLPGTVKHFGS
jgi:hypothetical protein